MVLQLINSNRFYRIIFYLLYTGIIFPSCKQHESTNCSLTNTLSNSISIQLPDSIVKRQVVNMQFSHFEKDRIWIKTNKGYDTIFVFDLNTKDIVILDKRLNQAFYNPSQMIYDSLDSVYWISGYKFVRYNHISKKISEYNIGYNKFYNSPLRMYFVTSDTLKYLNKKTSEISAVNEVLGTKIVNIEEINDSLLWVNNSFTFNLFTSEILLSGDSFQNNLHKNNYSFHSLKSGIEIYSNNGRLYWIGKNQINELPYEFQSNKNVVVENGSIWQHDLKFINQYDISSQKLSKYFFRFPFSTYNLQDFYIKENYIWFNPQPYAISLIDSECYSYQLSGTDVPLKLLIDDCNIYQLFGNSIVITPLSQLKKSLIRFDSRSFDFDVMQFYEFTDKCYRNSDSTVEQVISTINKVKDAFRNSKNEEILTKLADFETNHFYKVKFHSNRDYFAHCSNESLPFFFRYNCYEALLRKTAREGSFNDLLKYYYKFENIYSENLDQKYRRDNINIIENYLKHLDSLNKTDLTKDSITFLKAKSLDKVCKTEWFESENRFNFDLYKNALLRFIKQFPNSSLVDNAEFYYWNNYYGDYCSEGGPGEEWSEKIINCYKRLLIKYPESDVRDKMDYEIFDLKYWSKQYSDKQIITLAKRFIQLYPSSIHIKDIESGIENITDRQAYFH